MFSLKSRGGGIAIGQCHLALEDCKCIEGFVNEAGVWC
jgi:hypothetical protein